MPFDSSYDEYHLTLGGWVPGASAYMTRSRPAGAAAPPADRIETWVRTMTQASGVSREIVNWRLDWADPNTPESERVALRKGLEKPHRDFGRRDYAI